MKMVARLRATKLKIRCLTVHCHCHCPLSLISSFDRQYPPKSVLQDITPTMAKGKGKGKRKSEVPENLNADGSLMPRVSFSRQRKWKLLP
jgi:hypothetical protein